jgi:hypothetical protein
MFTFGAHHTFKLHSMVMSKKSTWFAQQYGPGPHAPGHHFEIARDCLSLEITSLFEIKHCDAHDASADCQLHALLTVLLYSCYVDEYSCEFDAENIKAACRGNIYIYVLGLHLGIDSILPKCVAAFAKAMDFLKKDTELFPSFINLVYDMIGIDDQDALLVEARSQAQSYAKEELAGLQTGLIKLFRQSTATKAMPKATQDIEARLFAPAGSNLGIVLRDVPFTGPGNTSPTREGLPGIATPESCTQRPMLNL